MKRLLLRIMVLSALAGTFLITGCAGITVRNQLDDPGFQDENLPFRTLRVGIFGDGTYSREEIVRLMDGASYVLERQLGINLETVFSGQIRLEKGECNIMLDNLHDSALNITGDFDIAAAFVNPGLAGRFTRWNGVIDDSYRRYIIILKGSIATFTHEIGHCFIFSHNHSPDGVMKSTPYTVYFSPEDRREILRNKWRDFNVKPDLDERCMINLLKEDRK